jgi:hypothetical protein
MVDKGRKELSDDSQGFPFQTSRCIPPLQATPVVQLPAVEISGNGCET